MIKSPILSLFLLAFLSLSAQPSSRHDLHFPSLAVRWDEAIPLGNGMLGALVWEKDSMLRFSLDRADLWDLRPMNGLHRPEFRYAWVQQQVAKGDYAPVQQYFDAPYDREPAPSRIPGAALQFDARGLGTVHSVRLHLRDALCEVRWTNGAALYTFVHAEQPAGWFRFTHVPEGWTPELVAPPYAGAVTHAGDPVGGDDLARLGYPPGDIKREERHIHYLQPGWNGFYYRVSVRWRRIGKHIVDGVWSISAHTPGKAAKPAAGELTQAALKRGFLYAYRGHRRWWARYWKQSALRLPDTRLERQWYLEQYKFGSSSRRGAPPISLQAVWTADNGRLPPWKGDYHHDLNTQLSYWPCYSGNHLEEGLAYLDHLDANKDNYRRYTRQYFEKDGLCVPGVSTLDGTEMGGWIQYSLSPTVSAWLAHHYYLHWRYSMDRRFLQERAYPWLRETAVFLRNMTVPDAAGRRKLPISSSPEINDNQWSAWFLENTNYDLALMKFAFQAAAEMADELELPGEAAEWRRIGAEFGDFALTPDRELMFAPTLACHSSHRHFSHLMAIHPLGLIRWEDGPAAQAIIRNSLRQLDSVGPSQWCGYSYAWLGSLKARAKDGAGAARALDIFARAFCSPNSFHLNGDQSGQGYSSFTYRPFTLEGNFAFAAGLQEMLVQSYAGYIEILPAVPADWDDLWFRRLRAEGAFLVSARKTGGQVREVKIESERGGMVRVKLPFRHWRIASRKKAAVKDLGEGMIEVRFREGGGLTVHGMASSLRSE